MEKPRCSDEGCTRPAKCRGLCNAHYLRLRRHGSTAKLDRRRYRVCDIPGCGRPHEGLGLCSLHRQRVRRGTPLGGRPTTQDKFWATVDRDGPIPAYRPELGSCWIWTGYTDPNGYGNFRRWRHNVTRSAHRIAWEWLRGPIPTGLQLDHLCRVRACVNPDHLEPVTPKINQHRGYGEAAKHVRQTHCIHGHAFTPENTRIVIRASGTTSRQCRMCERLRRAARKKAITA